MKAKIISILTAVTSGEVIPGDSPLDQDKIIAQLIVGTVTAVVTILLQALSKKLGVEKSNLFTKK